MSARTVISYTLSQHHMDGKRKHKQMSITGATGTDGSAAGASEGQSRVVGLGWGSG